MTAPWWGAVQQRPCPPAVVEELADGEPAVVGVGAFADGFDHGSHGLLGLVPGAVAPAALLPALPLRAPAEVDDVVPAAVILLACQPTAGGAVGHRARAPLAN